MWSKLSRRQMIGLKFRRQAVIKGFIADFYCPQIRLVVEVDGGYHQEEYQANLDQNRDAIIESMKIKVVRFTNEQVSGCLNSVLREIEVECRALIC